MTDVQSTASAGPERKDGADGMTTEELARLFLQRMADFEAKVDKVEASLGRLAAKVDRLDARAEAHAGRTSARTRSLSAQLDGLAQRAGSMEQQLSLLGERLTNVETRQIYPGPAGQGPSPLEPVRYAPSGHAMLEPERRWRKSSARRGG